GRAPGALPRHGAAADHRDTDHDWQRLWLEGVRCAAGSQRSGSRLGGEPWRPAFAAGLDHALAGNRPRRHGAAAPFRQTRRCLAANAVTENWRAVALIYCPTKILGLFPAQWLAYTALHV